MKRRVLVFPAGTEVGLEIFHALIHCKEVSLFGAGQDISNPAKFVFPSYHVIPSIHESDWLESLVRLCISLGIDYIFPAYDDVIVALSRVAKQLPAKLISSPLHACEITRSKSSTYRFLEGIVPTPRLYASAEEVSSYPVIVKPDRGQGSFGVVRVDDKSRLAATVAATPEGIICEYLPGAEYTIDCFSDRERGVLFAGARQRRRIRNGISVNTINCDLPDALDFARRIGGSLDLHGAWFFQLKRALDGHLVLLEVAPRIAGAMAAHRVAGVNFPLLSLFEEERTPLKIVPLEVEVELDRCLASHYRHSIEFDTLYIDFDDTLIIDNQVNLLAIKLIFQCINASRKIILLTRHEGNLRQTLRQYRLDSLFDEIIHLRKEERKSTRICSKNAIFVDDSFAERMEVAKTHKIPTFDCSMIEMLTEKAEFLHGATKPK
jgi:hypothetical protein